MKNQLTAILTMAFLLSTFTGCNTAPTSSDSEISDSQPETSTSSKKIYSTSSLTDSFSLPPKVESEPEPEVLNPFEKMRIDLYGEDYANRRIDITPETEWVKDDFDYNLALLKRELYFPDGTPFDSSKAIRASGNKDGTYYLTFDFAFVRYALPIYYSSADDPDVYDWDWPPITDITEVQNDFFRVKAGDKLSNGLTVKEAEYTSSLNGWDSYHIEYDGELILKGTLILSDEEGFIDLEGNEIYSTKGNIYFIPFADQISDFITSNNGFGAIEDFYGTYFNCSNPKFASYSDIGYIRMGHINDYSEEIKDIFKDGNSLEAVVTFNELMQYIVYGSGTYFRQVANIVSCELLGGE